MLETCLRLGIALAQTLVRADGEYGNIAGIWAFKERGLHFVTRLNRVQIALRQAGAAKTIEVS